jgi:hypothetical protein
MLVLLTHGIKPARTKEQQQQQHNVHHLLIVQNALLRNQLSVQSHGSSCAFHRMHTATTLVETLHKQLIVDLLEVTAALPTCKRRYVQAVRRAVAAGTDVLHGTGQQLANAALQAPKPGRQTQLGWRLSHAALELSRSL